MAWLEPPTFDHPLLSRAMQIDDDPARWNVLQRKLHPRAFLELQKWADFQALRRAEAEREEAERAQAEAAYDARLAEAQRERRRQAELQDMVRRVGEHIAEPVFAALDWEDLVTSQEASIRRTSADVERAAAAWWTAAEALAAELPDTGLQPR